MRPIKKASSSKDKKKVRVSPFVHTAELDGTTGRPRAATFVSDTDLKPGGTAMTGSANEVVRSKLRSDREGLVISADRSVFFKRHDTLAPSQFAVASTRLARFLGMPDVIAHNAFARIQGVEGVVSGRVTGIPMLAGEWNTPRPTPTGYGASDIADWVSMNQLVKKGERYYARSAYVVAPVDFSAPVVQKGLSDLQLFDALSGQTDRHGANIYVDPTTGVVTGIDDDFSFGNGQPAGDTAGAAFKKDKYAGLPALVDERTAALILDRDPDALAVQLGQRENDLQLLTPAQIADARRRLVAVQDYLRDLRDRGLLVRQWTDATYQQARLQGPASYLGREAAMCDDAAAKRVDNAGTASQVSYKLAKGPRIPQRPLLVNPPDTAPPPVPARPPVVDRVAAGSSRRQERGRAVLFAAPPVVDPLLFAAPPVVDPLQRAAQARLGAQRVRPLPAIGDADATVDGGGLQPLTGPDRNAPPTIDLDELMTAEQDGRPARVVVDPAEVELVGSDEM